MAISHLIDILQDPREVIRNEGILALLELTRSSPAIQKIVVFENTFDFLLQIIEQEGHSDGSVVVADCLNLMLQLLADNTSNIGFFRENTFIPRLSPFFDMNHTGMATSENMEEGEGTANLKINWNEKKIDNVILMLSVVRAIVAPTIAKNDCKACQNVVRKSGLLPQLCGMLMATGVPAPVLAETISTVADTVRNNQENQDYLCTVAAPFQPPRPLVTVLLMSMINENQPLVLRLSILYCFQALYGKNTAAQSKLVATLLPQQGQTRQQQLSAGQLLLSGFFGRDSTARWLSCIALSHGVAGNSQQKEQLLRVQVTTGVGNPSISLLQQCSNTLITSSTQGKFVVNSSIYFTVFNFVLCFFWCFCVCVF